MSDIYTGPLPETVCSVCGKSKICGVFTPAELQSSRPRCMTCVGLLSDQARNTGWRRTHAWKTRKEAP